MPKMTPAAMAAVDEIVSAIAADPEDRTNVAEGLDAEGKGWDGVSGDNDIPLADAVRTVKDATSALVAKQKPTYGQKGRTTTSSEMFGSLEEDTDYYKWLMYGPQGSGKTTAACKAANHGKILVLRAEGGLKKGALASHGIDVSNIMVFPKQQGRRIRKEDLIAVHEQLLADLEEDPNSWYAVVLDSITEIHHTLREVATKQRVKRVLGRLTDPKLIAEFDEDFIDRDDYGKMTGQLREILRDYRDLPCHVIFTALQKVDDTTAENVPAITPALRIDLMGYVDILTAHRGEDDSYRALTRASGKTHAKDRFNKLPKVWSEPDFDRLIAYMDDKINEQSDHVQIEFNKAAEEAAAIAAAEAAAKEEAKKAIKTRRPAASKPTATN